ncbi:hypothetical protein A2U01_0062148, partial [Trifolium medium]|nr:hypothetical protein [Trifolium medium]
PVDLVSDLAMSHFNSFLGSTDPLESGLFTLKPLRAEPIQLSIVHGRQGITLENRSGPRRSSSKNEVEAQTQEDVWTKIFGI